MLGARPARHPPPTLRRRLLRRRRLCQSFPAVPGAPARRRRHPHQRRHPSGQFRAGAFVSGGFKASDAVIPELDVSYFFTKNWAVEAICCVSYHKVYLDGGNVAPDQQAASTWLFPPTALVQYHWTDFGHFQPYIGVGVNYTVYFHQHAAEPLLNTVAIQNSWGVAGQIGFDYMIDDHWGFNFDVKKILMNPHVYGTVAPGAVSISGQANLSPWLIGGGITYRFGGAAPAAVVAKY